MVIFMASLMDQKHKTMMFCYIFNIDLMIFTNETVLSSLNFLQVEKDSKEVNFV